MARRNPSPFSQLQQQARKVLAGLGSQISSKKSELARLELEFAQLAGLAGSLSDGAVGKPGRTSARINWSEVLAKLPKQFKAGDIRRIRGLKDKRPSELFSAITRWIDSGAVKKKTRGVYLHTK